MKTKVCPTISDGLLTTYDYPTIIKMQSQQPIAIISKRQKSNEQYKSDTVTRTLKKTRTTNK